RDREQRVTIRQVRLSRRDRTRSHIEQRLLVRPSSLGTDVVSLAVLLDRSSQRVQGRLIGDRGVLRTERGINHPQQRVDQGLVLGLRGGSVLRELVDLLAVLVHSSLSSIGTDRSTLHAQAE